MKIQRPSAFTAAAWAAGALIVLAGCSKPGDPATSEADRADATLTGSAETSVAPSSDSAAATVHANAGAVADATPSTGTVSESATSGLTAATTTALSNADKDFLKKAAEGGLFEVAVGQLAAQKAIDPAVKSFGTMLVEQHTAANDKLKAVAQSQNAELPSAVPADKQKQIDKLATLSGTEFDRQFVETVGLKDHQNDIALFERTAKNSDNPAVKEFASSTLPTLKEHLSHAQALPQAGSKSKSKG